MKLFFCLPLYLDHLLFLKKDVVSYFIKINLTFLNNLNRWNLWMNLNYGQFAVLKFLLRCLFFNASLTSLVCVWIHIGTKCMEILISLSMIKKYIQSFNAEKIYKNHHKSDMVVLLVEATEFYDIYVICLIISLFHTLD